MASFAYTAKDKTGALQKGSLFALDRSAAAANLNDKGLTPILIQEDKPQAQRGLAALKNIQIGGTKVKLTEKVVFSRQLATMVNAGVPITKSLAILKEQTSSKALQTVIADLAKRVEGGTTLASALGNHPKVFSAVYINMVKAGETGGILDEVLERLAMQQEKDAEIVGKVRGAMIYPGVITTVTIAAFFFLMTVIVPKLGAIFEDLGVELPAYTRFLLSLSKFLSSYSLLLIGGSAVGLVVINRLIKTEKGKQIFDTLLLRMPVFGKIIRKVNIARFARTFGALMSSGIAILDALNATASALGNSVYKDSVTRVAHEVKNGKNISAPLRSDPNFPPIVSHMVAVGEETGKLDSILVKLAEFYEKEVDSIVAGITSIIEPILIIVIGGMVGFIIISIFAPLSSLSTAI